jgi:hypothetical protein
LEHPLLGKMQAPVLQDILLQWQRWQRRQLLPIVRILLSGSTGFIGRPLMAFLQKEGHQVVALVRHRGAQESVYWDPSTGTLSPEDFEGFDAVIHLAGENIAAGRWTKKRKDQLFLSRCRDTWLLSQVLSRLSSPPRIVLCASAVGIYGNRGAEILTEKSAPGTGFLAHLTLKWEEATRAIAARGSRVVHMRFGTVLSPSGGMLRKMLPLFKWGLGGKLGSGEQYISWIALSDLLTAIYHCLTVETLSGPVNITAPNSITQAEFAKQLATFLRRPAFFHIPAILLRLVFAEMGEELLLASTRAYPQKLLDSGYNFRMDHLSCKQLFL